MNPSTIFGLSAITVGVSLGISAPILASNPGPGIGIDPGPAPSSSAPAPSNGDSQRTPPTETTQHPTSLPQAGTETDPYPVEKISGFQVGAPRIHVEPITTTTTDPADYAPNPLPAAIIATVVLGSQTICTYLYFRSNAK